VKIQKVANCLVGDSYAVVAADGMDGFL